MKNYYEYTSDGKGINYKNNLTEGKIYKCHNEKGFLIAVMADNKELKLVLKTHFVKISGIELFVYFLMIGVKYFTLLITIAAFIAGITGAYHQFYISIISGLLYYLQIRKN